MTPRTRKLILHGASAMTAAAVAGWSAYSGSLPLPAWALTLLGLGVTGLNAVLAMVDAGDAPQ